MIQIGEAFFDESFCFGIAPDRDSRQTGGSIVFLQNGSRVAIDATTEDVAAALRENGLLEEDSEEDEIPGGLHKSELLTDEESSELRDCLESDYVYIARDIRGYVFAFHLPPVREGAYWNSCPGDSAPKRLFGTYSALDFEKGYMLTGSALYDRGIPF